MTQNQGLLKYTVVPIFAGILLSFMVFYQFTHTTPLAQMMLGDVHRINGIRILTNQWKAKTHGCEITSRLPV